MNSHSHWSVALSACASLEGAIEEVVDRARQPLEKEPNLAIVFISAAFASEYTRLIPLLRSKLPDDIALAGCSGGGIVGGDGRTTREVEEMPALSLTLACLPGVRARAFHIKSDGLPDLDGPPQRWIEAIGEDPGDRPQFLLFADPGTSHISDLLQGLDFAYPESPKVGGLASGFGFGQPTGIFCNDCLYREGTVGLALSGQIVLETIVAQGCRPIGKPYRVTEADRNILSGLAGETEQAESPLEVLRELVQTLSEDDRKLAQNSLFVGIVRDEFKPNLQQGDFLIRNLLGVDPKVGAMAVGDRVRAGQRIQFHLRDAQTSAEDLEFLLQDYEKQRQSSKGEAIGALMFSCLGRGERLYQKPNFDSKLFHQYLGDLPLSGFFCNGEIGPVGGTTFLHGYTSVFGILRQPA